MSTSYLVILPFGPVPDIAAKLYPLSKANFLANGEELTFSNLPGSFASFLGAAGEHF